MNFKEEYKKEYDHIVPDRSFLNQLQQDMEHEKKSTIRIHSSLYRRVAVAAACIALVTASLLVLPKITNKASNTQQEVTHLGGTSEQTATTPGVFTSDSWYFDDLSDTEIVRLFCTKLNSTELDKLYHNDNNTFSNDNLMSGKEITDLLTLVSAADSIAIKPSEYTASDYYMACFSNGDIIKFTMNSEYIQIPDANIYMKR